MRKSNCLFSKLKSRILLALTVFALAFAVAGCDSPAGTVGPVEVTWANITGTWQDIAYGNYYEISETKINDVMMDCEYEVKSSNFVISADGYSFIFCKCTKGTSWTPKDYYFTVAVKLFSNGKIKLICPMNYNDRYSSLSELEQQYTESSTIGTNWCSDCKKAGNGVTVFDANAYMSKCDFRENFVSVSMQGVDGWGVYDSFMPTRDKSKEDGNVKLYLYDSSERDLVGDLHYCEVVDENGTYYVYWYHYDEDEDDNDSKLEMMFDGTFGSNCMPIVSETYLTKLKSLYK